MNIIRTYLETAKITQAELARRVNISRSYMNQVVQGERTPSLKVAAAIEKVTRGKVKAIALLEKPQ